MPKERDGKITAKGRRALPRAKFALPSGPEERSRGIKGRFPIDTATRARNALARGSQFASASQQAQIRRAVAQNFPDIEVTQKTKGRLRGG